MSKYPFHKIVKKENIMSHTYQHADIKRSTKGTTQIHEEIGDTCIEVAIKQRVILEGNVIN